MENQSKSICYTVDYVCDNCKLENLHYLRPEIVGVKPRKVYGCKRCGYSVVVDRDYPHQLFSKDLQKVEPLSDLEITAIRRIISNQEASGIVISQKPHIIKEVIDVHNISNLDPNMAQVVESPISSGSIENPFVDGKSTPSFMPDPTDILAEIQAAVAPVLDTGKKRLIKKKKI